MKLTVEQIKQVVLELDKRVNHYVYKKDLFSGGCCFSAYVLAKNLRKLGIKYNVVLYQYDDIIDAEGFTEAVNGDGVGHVAIEVEVGGKKMIIGCPDNIYLFFFFNNLDFNVRRYKRITPMRLLRAYMQHEWNPCYNINYNRPLMRDITAIAEKYIEKCVNR